jgi:hypothetical protein
MNKISKLGGALLLGAGAIVISGCAATLPAQVTRFQAMPAPTGQSFYVVPGSGQPAGLEFGQYASLVSQQLAAKGYRPAGAPQLADMLVRLDYGVDEGTREIREDPFSSRRYRDPFYDPYWGVYFGRPYYSRYGYYGYSSPFYWGWNDPFWYDDYYGGRGRDREYTVFKSHLDMNIVRRADNQPLFEGHAKARSQTDELGVLVPNLVEAMFTGFPGRSGETVKITVPAKRN